MVFCFGDTAVEGRAFSIPTIAEPSAQRTGEGRGARVHALSSISLIGRACPRVPLGHSVPRTQAILTCAERSAPACSASSTGLDLPSAPCDRRLCQVGLELDDAAIAPDALHSMHTSTEGDRRSGPAAALSLPSCIAPLSRDALLWPSSVCRATVLRWPADQAEAQTGHTRHSRRGSLPPPRCCISSSAHKTRAGRRKATGWTPRPGPVNTRSKLSQRR